MSRIPAALRTARARALTAPHRGHRATAPRPPAVDSRIARLRQLERTQTKEEKDRA